MKVKFKAFHITLFLPVDFSEAVLKKKSLGLLQGGAFLPSNVKLFSQGRISWKNVIQNCVYIAQWSGEFQIIQVANHVLTQFFK